MLVIFFFKKTKNKHVLKYWKVYYPLKYFDLTIESWISKMFA